jgi:hypothetical protein
VRIFSFDATAAAAAYRSAGWVHIPDGITPEFHRYAREFIRAALDLGPLGVGDNRANKDQFRFVFPNGIEMQDEVFPLFETVSGLRNDDMVVSERHVNAYRDDAVPDPIPHKDRYASQLSIGITIDVAPGSHLILYPDHDRSVNPYASAAQLYAALPPERRPETVLKGVQPVEIHDRPGDVVAFAGSSTWHCRRQAAGTTNLFLKLNDFGHDPLGEDARATAISASGASQVER